MQLPVAKMPIVGPRVDSIGNDAHVGRTGKLTLRTPVRPSLVVEAPLRTTAGKQALAELLSPRGVEAWQFHNVGLDDAEGAPERLWEGMVVAYELMFALDGEGYYLEDMLLVEPRGYRNLTPGLPYTAIEIERTMQRPPAVP